MKINTIQHNTVIAVEDLMEDFFKETGECFDIVYRPLSEHNYVYTCYDLQGNFLFDVRSGGLITLGTGEVIKDEFSGESTEMRVNAMRKLYSFCLSTIRGTKQSPLSLRKMQLFLSCGLENPSDYNISNKAVLKRLIPIAPQYIINSPCTVKAIGVIGYLAHFTLETIDHHWGDRKVILNYADFVTVDVAKQLNPKLPDTVKSSKFKYNNYALTVHEGNVYLFSKDDRKPLLPESGIIGVLYNHERRLLH